LPVQWVNRPNQDFRGFAGTIASGTSAAATMRVLPSGRQSRVTRIVSHDGDLESAVAGQSVTLTLADEIDVSRGDVLAAADAPPAVADQFQATIIWMHEEPMLRGRPYIIKVGTRALTGSITSPKYKVNVNTLERLARSSWS
jgi:bifunctional enzyme CysN/CysC